MITYQRRARATRLWAGLAALLIVPATIGISAPAAGASGSNTLTVKAGEYVYQLKGSPKAGWTQIVFDNTGVEDHMMAVFKLKKGTTAAQLKKAATSSSQSAFEKIAAPGGDPSVAGTPALLGPGQKTTTLTQLPAGTYGILCFLPAPDGKSHAEHGMFKVFTVSGKSSLKPPTDGVAEASISDAGITVPSSGVPAHGWVKVTNETSVTRDFTVAEYTAPDATFEAANAYYNEFFSSGKVPEGDPPATLNGGVGAIAAGSSAYFEVDLDQGRYALVSSNQDLDNGDANPLHTDFTIT